MLALIAFLQVTPVASQRRWRQTLNRVLPEIVPAGGAQGASRHVVTPPNAMPLSCGAPERRQLPLRAPPASAVACDHAERGHTPTPGLV